MTETPDPWPVMMADDAACAVRDGKRVEYWHHDDKAWRRAGEQATKWWGSWGWAVVARIIDENEDDAPAADPESLPPGVRRAFVLDAGAGCPDGWERRNTGSRDEWIYLGNGTMAAVEVRPVPEPETERVPVLDAIATGRTLVGADGTPMDTGDGSDVLVYRKNGRWRVMYDDAGHPVERRPVADPDGTVEVLVSR